MRLLVRGDTCEGGHIEGHYVRPKKFCAIVGPS
jgi:hypothetical protein